MFFVFTALVLDAVRSYRLLWNEERSVELDAGDDAELLRAGDGFF
jgi:hypothetical protein